MASEIWSDILSGWPSETDSEVNTLDSDTALRFSWSERHLNDSESQEKARYLRNLQDADQL